jgi:hypothetical protein
MELHLMEVFGKMRKVFRDGNAIGCRDRTGFSRNIFFFSTVYPMFSVATEQYKTETTPVPVYHIVIICNYCYRNSMLDRIRVFFCTSLIQC